MRVHLLTFLGAPEHKALRDETHRECGEGPNHSATVPQMRQKIIFLKDTVRVLIFACRSQAGPMATPLPSPPQGNSPTPASIAALIRGTVESDEAAVALCAKALNILQSNSLEDAHKRVSILGLGGEEDGAAAAGEPRSIEVASPPLPPRSEKGASGATTTWSEVRKGVSAQHHHLHQHQVSFSVFQVVLHRPAFMAYSFLRVPPPCCPRVNEGTEGALASYPTQADAGTARLAEPSPEIIVSRLVVGKE